MALTSQTSAIEYDGNNSAVTAYAVPFMFFADAHLKVTVTTSAGVATVLTLTTHYTVTGANSPSGGTLATVTAVPTTSTVRIERVVPLTQPFVYEEGGRLPMKSLEKNFDTLAMQAQQVQRVVETLPTEAVVDQKIVDAQLDGPTADSVLTLLEGEDIEVASIGLTDGTGTALAAGRLTLNATGGVVIHDNESNAEDLPHLVNSRNSINFAKRASFVSGATQTHLIAKIPMTSAELANNKLLHIFGEFRALWTTRPTTPAIHLVICREGQSPTTDGIRLLVATAATSEVVSFHLPLRVAVSSGTWSLSDTIASHVGIAQKNSAGTLTHGLSWEYANDYEDISAVSGVAGEPAIIEIHLRTSNASSTGLEYIFVSGNVSAVSQ